MLSHFKFIGSAWQLTRGARHPFAAAALLGALVLWVPLGTLAATLQGVVVAIQDGDTLTVLDDATTQHRIRLAGIDAPEKGQPFGRRSKEGLSDLVYRRDVVVEWRKHDRYGRVVGKVLLANRDINLAQVEAGLAWHYADYAREQSSSDRAVYSQAEALARASRLGLWREPAPVAPWEFRKSRREAAHVAQRGSEP